MTSLLGPGLEEVCATLWERTCLLMSQVFGKGWSNCDTLNNLVEEISRQPRIETTVGLLLVGFAERVKNKMQSRKTWGNFCIFIIEAHGTLQLRKSLFLKKSQPLKRHQIVLIETMKTIPWWTGEAPLTADSWAQKSKFIWKNFLHVDRSDSDVVFPRFSSLSNQVLRGCYYQGGPSAALLAGPGTVFAVRLLQACTIHVYLEVEACIQVSKKVLEG